jgi:regulator of ribonuclease activity A
MQDLLPEICDQFADTVRILPPMFKNYGGKATFYGEVVTVKAFEDNSKIRELVSQHGAGKVIVVDGGGSLRHAMLGDMLAEKAAANEWQGIIINGCVRDVNAMAKIDLGVQALAAHPLKTEKRGLGDINIAITIGGVLIEAGQYIYADVNGVLISDEELDLKALGWS